MNENQLSIYDMINEKYKITKPIRLIEFFAGYGSQALALKYLGVPFEHWKICEWAVKSIQAYKDIHFTDIMCLRQPMSKEELVDYLYNKGISQNYNEPRLKKQIERLNEQTLNTIYNNIQITHNLVNIQQVKGEDLEIKNQEHFTYLLTYSFPCQDLSLAGKGKGMSDTSTRSGMLWEVERILKECKELGNMPQILLMENVPQVHGKKNLDDFNKWQDSLESMGYKNYWQDLIATDYGIPQTRKRTFMISILGDYTYEFPKSIPLKLKLKDMLEEQVDEKYYITDTRMKYFMRETGNFPRKERFLSNINRKNQDISNTITTGEGNVATSTFIKIKNNTKKGYLEAYEGDGVDIGSRMSYHRGTVQKQTIQAIMTSGGEERGVIMNDLKIRKLTPKECFRLMGVKDEDFEKCAKNQSDSSLYHLAGDSIVVNVLMAIFKELL